MDLQAKKALLEAEAEEKLKAVMFHLGRLVNAVEKLDDVINESRGAFGPTERPFFVSKKYQWAVNHLTDLKRWEKEYNRTFETGG